MDAYDEMIAANRGDEPDQIDMMEADELRTGFRASQAREAALRGKLENMSKQATPSDFNREMLKLMTQRAEAAEALLECERRTHLACAEREKSYAERIKASQEQEPVAVENRYESGLIALEWPNVHHETHGAVISSRPLYAQRTIYTEVAEGYPGIIYDFEQSKRELAELQRENEELREAFELVKKLHIKATTECAELRKLLESKVPEGSLVISSELVRFLNGEDCIEGVWFGDEHPRYRGRFWWRKLLPTQPKEPKQ